MSEHKWHWEKRIEEQAARIETLEAALRNIAGQRLTYEHNEGEYGDFEHHFNHLVLSARAALATLASAQDT